MPELRKQSNLDDRYMVLFGQHVIVCDLTKAQAEAIVKAPVCLVSWAGSPPGQ
jgi:hypothetical protein